MPDEDETADTYFCIVQEPGRRLPTRFQIAMDVESLHEWADQPKSSRLQKEVDDQSTAAGKNQPEDSKSFISLLHRITESVHQQFEIINLFTVVRSTFPMTMAQSSVVNGVLKDSEEIFSSDAYRIIKIKDQIIPDMLKELSRINMITRGLGQIPNAVLLSMVSTFDSQMSDIVRAMLATKSDRMQTGNRQVSLSTIMSASSIQEVIDQAIDDEVYQFSRNGHDDQVKYIEESFHIAIRKNWKRWPDLIEVFERRNLVAHGEPKFTARYVKICLSHGHKGSSKVLGDPVTISPKYLKQCLDLLSEFAILTIFNLWRKHSESNDEQSFEALSTVVFDLISNKRYAVAAYLCDFALSLNNVPMREHCRLRFIVNLASATMHMGRDDAANKVLEEIDWSAKSDDFRICVAALRRDVKLVNTILPMVKASGSIDIEDFRNWPTFDFVREDKEFLKHFKDTFGKDITLTNAGKLIKGASEEIEKPDSADDTAETQH